MYTREEAKKLRKEFWITFAERCELVPQLRGRRKKWILYDTKISGLDLKFEIGRDRAAVILEVNSKNEIRRLRIFELLERYKVILENDLDDLIWELVFEGETGKDVSRIYAELTNVDFHRKSQWPDIFNFFIDRMWSLENNFLEIRDLLIAELEN